MKNIIINGLPEWPKFIFAHGAGAGMDHPFMETIASELEKHQICVIRFDFPYMEQQKELNKKRPPDRAPKLLEAYQQIIKEYANDQPIVIGGKSMGGRIASLLEQDDLVKGVACLGYPFHPPGKPEKFKGEHLAQFEKPCLILQGERDTFGKREEFEQFSLSTSIRVEFIADGDHSFKPRKSSGATEMGNLESAASYLAQFIKETYDA
ncbi:alpha/beta fold hydrolase [Vibrio sp.]|nr:alpha/beta fold hydrolase [Vibrio sp.]